MLVIVIAFPGNGRVSGVANTTVSSSSSVTTPIDGVLFNVTLIVSLFAGSFVAFFTKTRMVFVTPAVSATSSKSKNC